MFRRAGDSNDAFEPGAPDAPASVLRLAWVVRVTTSGTLAETIRGLELFLDAGDGRLLGRLGKRQEADRLAHQLTIGSIGR